jgi:O-antigen/teichoic acid export membrane protein
MSKKFLTDSLLYLISDIVNKSAIFLLIPVYTSVFTVQEYGVLEVVMIIIAFSSLIVSFASKTAYLRLGYDYDEKERKERLFDTIIFICILAIFLFTLLFTFQDTLVDFVGEGYSAMGYYILGYVFLLSINELSLVLLRFEKKVFKYLIFSFIKTTAELLAIIYFVVYLHEGVLGRVEGSLVSMIFVFLILFKVLIWKNITPSLNMTYLSHYVKYSLPLVLNQMVGWILISYDKLLVGQNFSMRELGFFALGSQILIIYKYTMESSLKAFNVELFSNPGLASDLKNILTLILSVSAIFALLFSFFANEFVLIMSNENYSEASDIIKYMVISKYISMGSAVYVMVLFAHKKTSAVSIISLKSLAVLLVVSTYLVPNYHYLGAGISAIIVNLIMFYYLTQEVKKVVKFDLGFKILLIFILFISGVGLSILDVGYTLSFVFLFFSSSLLYVLNKEYILKVVKG